MKIQQTLALVLFICLLLAPGISSADANDGEFLGFKLGDTYPVTESTEIVRTGDYLVVILNASAGNAPNDFEIINLFCSEVTHTIGRIRAFSPFDDDERAEASELASKYEKILNQKYFDWHGASASTWSRGALTNDTYLLGSYLRPKELPQTILQKAFGGVTMEYVAGIELSYKRESAAGDTWAELLKREAAEALLENTDLEGL